MTKTERAHLAIHNLLRLASRQRVSGAKVHRDELSKMLDFIREGDTVVVYKLDRLARSMKQLFDLVELFDEKGVGFKTLTGIEVDTTTNHGRLIFNIFGAIAEFERGLIRERTQAGRQRAINAGVKMGRPGLDPQIKSDIQQRIRDGQTWSQITEELGVSRSSVARCARNAPNKPLQLDNGRRKKRSKNVNAMNG